MKLNKLNAGLHIISESDWQDLSDQFKGVAHKGDTVSVSSRHENITATVVEIRSGAIFQSDGGRVRDLPKAIHIEVVRGLIKRVVK